MSKKTIFTGAATAIITPLTPDGIDYEAFGKLIDWQIESGIDALVVCGTTGEASTLIDEEHIDAIAFAVKRANHRVPIIAGTGSNDTAHAIKLATLAEKAGADALLVVTPYYNKTSQRGLIRYYTEIANSVSIPMILYNVPSRTGVNIEPSTYAALADIENIVGIKEANGNLSKIVETMTLVNGKLDLYSGNDDQIVPLLSLGGVGVISVLSNLLPQKTHDMVARFLEGDVKASAALQFELHELIGALFSDVNPIPVKAAMAKMGFCENYLRAPLVEMEEKAAEKLYDAMRAQGINI